ncbi:MAG: hypothetical protein R2788_18525 [Saprospiraceae bacterium]
MKIFYFSPSSCFSAPRDLSRTVFPKISKAQDAFKWRASGGIILVMSGLGFIASLLAIINVRGEASFRQLAGIVGDWRALLEFLYVSTK